MGKRKGGKPLGGLADALLQAGVTDRRAAEKARREKTREQRQVGREAAARLEQEHQSELGRQRQEEADASRSRQRTDESERQQERLRLAVRTHAYTGSGRRRWFYITRDGRAPFVEVSDEVARRLSDGTAGVVESLGQAATEHVVLTDPQALALLREHDPELVRFWNRGS